MTQVERWVDKSYLAVHFDCDEDAIDAATACGMPHAIILGELRFRVSEAEAWVKRRGRVKIRTAIACGQRTVAKRAAKNPPAAPPEPEPLWLYAIQAGRWGHIKLGIAKDPRGRLRDLQVSNAETLRGLAAWQIASRNEERRVHDRFHWIRVRGEWFLPHNELIAFVYEQGGRYDWKTGKTRPPRSATRRNREALLSEGSAP